MLYVESENTPQRCGRATHALGAPAEQGIHKAGNAMQPLTYLFDQRHLQNGTSDFFIHGRPVKLKQARYMSTVTCRT